MATPKWPHDHSERHRQAALKGWMTRRAMAGGVTRPKPAPAAKPAKPTKPKAKRRELTRIASVDPALLDPYKPPNPWALRTMYGDHQLHAALERYSTDELRRALPAVKARHPGTKPSGTSKAAIIAYIRKYVR